MKLKSIKFGGTSVGNARSIEECIKIIKSKLNKSFLIVTVSAVAGITDKLIEIVKFAKKNQSFLVKSNIMNISNIHKNILKDLLKDDKKAEYLWSREFNPILNKLYAITYGATLVEDVTDKTAAKICAFGEKLSSLLIVIGLKKNGVRSLGIESETIIKTDSNYLKATVNFKTTNTFVKKVLNPFFFKCAVPIVTGFIGSDIYSNVTLLGRGSSDYTASILAIASNSDTIEIWTDVNGIMTADPRIVKDAFSWNNLDINIMSEMAYSGAKVVHPSAIALAVKKNIPVYVYNTFNRSFNGTKITNISSHATGIVATPGNTIITVKNIAADNSAFFINKVTSIIARHNIPTSMCAASETSFTFSTKSEHFSEGLNKALRRFASVNIQSKLTKICFIGNEVTSNKDLLVNIFQICKEYNTQVYTMSLSASNTNITLIIDEHKTEVIVKSFHKKLLTKKNTQILFNSTN